MEPAKIISTTIPKSLNYPRVSGAQGQNQPAARKRTAIEEFSFQEWVIFYGLCHIYSVFVSHIVHLDAIPLFNEFTAAMPKETPAAVLAWRQAGAEVRLHSLDLIINSEEDTFAPFSASDYLKITIRQLPVGFKFHKNSRCRYSKITDLLNLWELKLNLTAITDACIDDLAQLSQLLVLEIYETQLTPKGVQRLRELLPNTTILLLLGEM